MYSKKVSIDQIRNEIFNTFEATLTDLTEQLILTDHLDKTIHLTLDNLKVLYMYWLLSFVKLQV